MAWGKAGKPSPDAVLSVLRRVRSDIEPPTTGHDRDRARDLLDRLIEQLEEG